MTEAFSGRSLDSLTPARHHAGECLQHSRQHFARPVAEVTRELQAWEEGGPGEKVGVPSGGTKKFDEPLI